MCLMTRITGDGKVSSEQCPSIETSKEDYAQALLWMAKHRPELTLEKLSKVLNKSVWWVFERLCFEDSDNLYPQKGEKWVLNGSLILEVNFADKFAVRWTNGAFSTYDDLKEMKKC